jgi:hypothetical protein
VVYGATQGTERRSLLQELSSIKSSVGGMPWFLAGDFNVIRHSHEKGGNVGFSCYEREFVDCIQDLEVDDIAFSSCLHTWTNKQSGDDFVCKKLDRVMANCAWIQLYGNSSVEFLERGVSDHSPALVSMAAYVSYGPKPFKFFNFWAEHKNFLDWVKEGWQVDVEGYSMYRLYAKLKSVESFKDKKFGSFWWY